MSRPLAFETDAHPAVEILLYEQKERRRLVANVLNVQQELPNIPVRDVAVKVRMDGRKA